eukprot:4902842-Pleurochrysis_carterae.AAC.1
MLPRPRAATAAAVAGRASVTDGLPILSGMRPDGALAHALALARAEALGAATPSATPHAPSPRVMATPPERWSTPAPVASGPEAASASSGCRGPPPSTSEPPEPVAPPPRPPSPRPPSPPAPPAPLPAPAVVTAKGVARSCKALSFNSRWTSCSRASCNRRCADSRSIS